MEGVPDLPHRNGQTGTKPTWFLYKQFTSRLPTTILLARCGCVLLNRLLYGYF